MSKIETVKAVLVHSACESQCTGNVELLLQLVAREYVQSHYEVEQRVPPDPVVTPGEGIATARPQVHHK